MWRGSRHDFSMSRPRHFHPFRREHAAVGDKAPKDKAKKKKIDEKKKADSAKSTPEKSAKK